jgi:glycosyltransferase involved in cell wall biosynthesis
MSDPARVGVVGPLLGGNAGWVDSPGEAVAAALETEGTAVRTTSNAVGRGRRSFDVGSVALRWRGRVDVVLVLVYSGRALALSDLGLRAARLAGARTIAWLHGGGLPDQEAAQPDVVQRTLRRADAVVAPSAWLAGWAEDLGHAATVIPNPVPVLTARDADHPDPRHPRLLWMRTYHELYDPLLALDVVERLRGRRPDAHLTMAGQDKGLQADVEDEVQRRGLQDVVTVRGFADATAKAELLRTHDVFLSTNRVDNAPVTVVEACGAGLLVVARAVGGVPDLLEHGAAGVLVEGRDAGALAGAVDEVLDQPDRADALVAGGHRLAAAHRWEVVGPAWHTLFAELLDA